MSLQKTLSDLAAKINAEIKGDKNCIITGIATLRDAKPGQISFLSNAKYRQFIKTTHASAVVINPSYSDFCQTNALIVNDPQYAYAILANEFAAIPSQEPGVHPTAVIGKNCHIASSVAIGANTVIEDNVSIGENTKIAANCTIGRDCQIGASCQLWSNVTIYYGVKVGDRVLLHSGVVVGSDGFSYANHDNAWHKIQQLGAVIIGDDVEIGANTTIDRGALSNTVIGKGVKLDNLIQVAHNVQIGENTAIAGCVGIAGSTKIGKNCMIGGAAGIGGHLDITDNVIITGMAMISNSIKEPGVYSSGTGFLKNRDWQKNVVRFRHLDEMAKKMQMLEDRLELLEAQSDEKD